MTTTSGMSKALFAQSFRRHGPAAVAAAERLFDMLVERHGEAPSRLAAGVYELDGQWRADVAFESDRLRGYVNCWADRVDGEWEMGRISYSV